MDSVFRYGGEDSDEEVKFFWFCFKTGFGIFDEQTMSEEIQAQAKALVDVCVYKFHNNEKLRQTILWSVSNNSDDDRKRVFFQLMEVGKQEYCENCKSSPCQHGNYLYRGSITAGCKVEERRVEENNSLRRIGTVMEGKFIVPDHLKREELKRITV